MKRIWLFSLLSVLLTIPLVFQNCGSPEVAFTQSKTSENPFGSGITRVVSVDPNQPENRPPIHLTTIVDNSFSTSEIHEDLINGFSKAIDQVKGFNVVSSLYTTSNSEGSDKSSTEIKEVITYTDENGNEVVLDPSEKGLLPPNVNYVEKKSYDLADSYFPDRKSLKYSFNKDNFELFKSIYSDSVAQLGVDGADQETGLCTLIKKVEENNKISDPQNKAYHIYVLASNEDDFTTLENCPLESSQETKYIESTQTSNCSPGDANCSFNFQVQQNATQNQLVRLQYAKPVATVKVNYTGQRIIEKYQHTKETAAHSISFEKQQSTYKYSVVKFCPKDNIPVPCATAIERTQVLNGSCNFSGTRSCNSTDLSTAMGLISGTLASDVHSCSVSCNESWVAQSLPNNQIADRNALCTAASKSCSGAELSVVSSFAGTSLSSIRACDHKCVTGSQTLTKTNTNLASSCSQASRTCTSQEISTISAPHLGVSSNLVTSCNYTCSSTNQNGSPILSSNKMSCEAGDTRSCTSADRNWLINNVKIGVLDSNINSCSVSCSVSNSNQTLTLTNESVPQCSSNLPCSNNHLQLAANHFGGTINDVKSCQLNCSFTSTPKPACSLTNITNANLCSDTAQLASLCTQAGASDLNVSTCSRSGGTNTIRSYTKQVQPVVEKKISDLKGVNKNKSLPGMIADRLKAVHGLKGFSANAFIYPSNDLTCTPPSYLSTGTKYEELSRELGANLSRTFPVCVSDYSPALDSLIKVAIESVLTTFNLELEETEQVFKITAVFKDGSKEVIPESQYQVFKQTVSFNNRDLLKDVESLEFSVWLP